MTVNHWLNAVTFNDEGLIPAIAQDQETGKILMMAWMNSEALSLTVDTKTAVYYSRSRHKLWHKGETSGHTQMVHDIFLDCDGDAIVLSVTQVGGISCHTGRHSCFYRQLNFEQTTPNWHTVEPVLKDPKDIYQHAIQVPKPHTEANAEPDSTDTNNADVAIDEPTTTDKPTTNTVDGTDVLSQLDIVLRDRKHSDADSSYVASLYAKGINKILEKVGEEAVETVIAAKDLAGYDLTKQPEGSDDVVKPQALVNDLIYEIADVWFHTLVTLAWFDIPSASILDELRRRFGLSGLDEKSSR